MREAIVSEARGWLGVRWRHQGRSRSGVDCAGLVICVAHQLGLTDFDARDYPRQAADETMLAVCRRLLLPIARPQLQPGDVLVTAWDNQRHIGIVGDHPSGLSLIHAYAAARRVVEARLDERMLARAIGQFRFPGVA